MTTTTVHRRILPEAKAELIRPAKLAHVVLRVELQYNVFDRAEDLQGFFDGGAYEENFMGILFDPEDLIARFESGEPLASLTARPSLPSGKTPWDMLGDLSAAHRPPRRQCSNRSSAVSSAPSH